MTAYDRWLEKPYTDQAEGEECEDCVGTGKVFTEEARASLIRDARTYTPEDLVKFIYTLDTEMCNRCGGVGQVEPPTKQDIEEARADELLSDPDFNRQTGRLER